jgi:hypothetical protein
MGLWSRIKKAVKKAVKWVVQKAKAVVRAIVRVVLTFVLAAINIWDLLFGFLNWPPKNLTLQIFILSDKNGPLMKEEEKLVKLIPSIEYARRVLKQRLNIKLRFYSETFVQILKEPAPNAALYHKPCTLSGIILNESGDAGEFYAKHIAGWNGIPISLRFPITIFLIQFDPSESQKQFLYL